MWIEDAPPALYVEQIAITTALLWLGQACHFLKIAAATLFFDCQCAGHGTDGQWSPGTDLTARTRDLEAYVSGLLRGRLLMSYVRAHVGHAWNECVDVIAKEASNAEHVVPRPPASNCKHSWLVTTVGWLQQLRGSISQACRSARANGLSGALETNVRVTPHP